MRSKPTHVEQKYRPGMRVRYHTREISPSGLQVWLKDQPAVLVRGVPGTSKDWWIQVDGETEQRRAKRSELVEDILPPLAWPGDTLDVTHSRPGTLLFGHGYEPPPPSADRIDWNTLDIPYEVDNGR